ncbi:hypothetical protein PQX77_010915 [Marasmius sp. AFHP31]|nr:hypothetical protein PQX77_010915 [Marasmius sp. AFHP31]
MSIRNTQAGSGWQNNNTHSGTQNINFVNNYNPAAPNPHKTLWEAIAGVGASHKAEHQFLRGACLEGTRERALGAISDWASAKNPGAPPIYWLSGAAGVGKSAIALTIAKSFEAMALLASSFFFFRSDPRRNNPSALMLTIAHAPATITPLMRNPIEQKISADPTILEANLEEQFRVLVLVPSLAWSKQRALWGAPVVPNIIIIDGLDECGDEDIQMRILSIIKSAYEHEPPLPLRFLICSRPEAWLREAFAAEPLHTLSNFIVLDDTFMPDKDIQRYYLHHFQDIVSSAKYSHVQFPDPWPSKRDLEILVERSCGQFVHAATVIKFIMLAYNHPIEQLRIILDGTSKRKLSKSPYHDLDCLYHVILNANPDHEQLIPILAAILVLPDYSTASPAIIEQVLGLPSGQVALTLRGMYSVLNIRGPKDRIELYHTSFEEYLVDHTRSCEFHVDLPARKHTIAHCWLRSLTMDRLRSLRYDLFAINLRFFTLLTHPCTLSDGQIYNKKRFDGLGWVDLCTSIPQPTRNLLHDLWNVDLANVFLLCPHDESRITYRWNDLFEELVLWLEKYVNFYLLFAILKPYSNTLYQQPRGVAIGHDQTSKIDGGDVYEHDMRRYCHAKSPNPDHSSHRVADGWNDLNLMEAQMHRLRNLPRCFHVEWRPGAELQLEIVCWVVECATECQCSIKLGTGTIDWTQQPVLLSECHCDPCGEHGSHNPEHVAYQDACMQYAKALNSMFAGMIARGERENQEAASRGTKLEHIFLNLVDSALLKHCHLGTELISLCHTFLELVKACPSVLDRTVNLELDMDIMKGKANLLEWIEVSVAFARFKFPLVILSCRD